MIAGHLIDFCCLIWLTPFGIMARVHNMWGQLHPWLICKLHHFSFTLWKSSKTSWSWLKIVILTDSEATILAVHSTESVKHPPHTTPVSLLGRGLLHKLHASSHCTPEMVFLTIHNYKALQAVQYLQWIFGFTGHFQVFNLASQLTWISLSQGFLESQTVFYS